MTEVFLDTSFAIAVTVSTDRYHETAADQHFQQAGFVALLRAAANS